MPARGPGLLALLAVLLVALLAGGCLTATTPERSTRPTLLEPRWQDEAFEEHIDFFEGAAGEEPVTAYVEAALRRAWLQPGVEGRYRLWRASGAPGGYVGYVGGKNPNTTSGTDWPVAEEAVLVCADLERGAVEAAALLEVARVYGIGSQYALMPERSVVFALWSRGAGGDSVATAPAGASSAEAPLAGLRTFLRQPTWRLDRVRAVLYMGLPPRRRAAARRLLDEYGIPLYSVNVPEDVQRLADASSSAPELSEAEAGEENVLAARARRLAERTHQRLRAATLTNGKLMPALGDTLRVPRSQQP